MWRSQVRRTNDVCHWCHLPASQQVSAGAARTSLQLRMRLPAGVNASESLDASPDHSPTNRSEQHCFKYCTLLRSPGTDAITASANANAKTSTHKTEQEERRGGLGRSQRAGPDGGACAVCSRLWRYAVPGYRPVVSAQSRDEPSPLQTLPAWLGDEHEPRYSARMTKYHVRTEARQGPVVRLNGGCERMRTGRACGLAGANHPIFDSPGLTFARPWTLGHASRQACWASGTGLRYGVVCCAAGAWVTSSIISCVGRRDVSAQVCRHEEPGPYCMQAGQRRHVPGPGPYCRASSVLLCAETSPGDETRDVPVYALESKLQRFS